MSHIDRLTHNDAMRMLRMTDMHARSRRGRRPRTPAEFARAMESMGETLLVNAIFGAPVVSGTTYEVQGVREESVREREREREREIFGNLIQHTTYMYMYMNTSFCPIDISHCTCVVRICWS